MRAAYWFRTKGPSGFGSGTTANEVCKGWDGSGKVAVVTGALGSLGLESTRVLAAHGCEVVMVRALAFLICF